MPRPGDKKAAGASSARSAGTAATQSSGFGFGGYVGATAVAPTAPVFQAKPSQAKPKASTTTSSNAESDAPLGGGMPLDGEVAQTLKHLTKRDATTKLKALQTLRVLIKQRNASEVTAMLPQWIYQYKKLYCDSVRSVRVESAHVLNDMLAIVGKAVAPHLKTLIGYWWVAQFDPYQEAASTARTAFQNAFPGRKQVDAVLYCRTDLAQCLIDNIGSTPQLLGDVRKDTPEEMEDRHERVVSASLLAFGMLVDVVVSAAEALPSDPGQQKTKDSYGEHLEELKKSLLSLLTKPGFLKISFNAKSGMVRAASFSLLRTLAARCPSLLSPAPSAGQAPPLDKSQAGTLTTDLAAVVLGSFHEKEGSNHGMMWDMVLTFVKVYPDSWSQVNLRKMVLPRLYSLFKHGCYGSGTVSYNALLPLVAMFPMDLISPSPHVLAQLLDCVWLGMHDMSVGRPSKPLAVDCYTEVLTWSLINGGRLASSQAPLEGGIEDYQRQLLLTSLIELPFQAVLQATPNQEMYALDVVCGAVRKVAEAAAGKLEGGDDADIGTLLEAPEAGPALTVLQSVLGSSLVSVLEQALGLDPTSTKIEDSATDSATASATDSATLPATDLATALAIDSATVLAPDLATALAADSATASATDSATFERVEGLLQRLFQLEGAGRKVAVQLAQSVITCMYTAMTVHKEKCSMHPAALRMLTATVRSMGEGERGNGVGQQSQANSPGVGAGAGQLSQANSPGVGADAGQRIQANSPISIETLIQSCLSAPLGGAQANASVELLVCCLQGADVAAGAGSGGSPSWDMAICSMTGMPNDASAPVDATQLNPKGLQLAQLLFEGALAPTTSTTSKGKATPSGSSPAPAWRCGAADRLASALASPASLAAVLPSSLDSASLAAQPTLATLACLLGDNLPRQCLVGAEVAQSVIRTLTACLTPQADACLSSVSAAAAILVLERAMEAPSLWSSCPKPLSQLLPIIMSLSWSSSTTTTQGNGIETDSDDAADDDHDSSDDVSDDVSESYADDSEVNPGHSASLDRPPVKRGAGTPELDEGLLDKARDTAAEIWQLGGLVQVAGKALPPQDLMCSIIAMSAMLKDGIASCQDFHNIQIWVGRAVQLAKALLSRDLSDECHEAVQSILSDVLFDRGADVPLWSIWNRKSGSVPLSSTGGSTTGSGSTLMTAAAARLVLTLGPGIVLHLGSDVQNEANTRGGGTSSSGGGSGTNGTRSWLVLELLCAAEAGLSSYEGNSSTISSATQLLATASASLFSYLTASLPSPTHCQVIQDLLDSLATRICTNGTDSSRDCDVQLQALSHALKYLAADVADSGAPADAVASEPIEVFSKSWLQSKRGEASGSKSVTCTLPVSAMLAVLPVVAPVLRALPEPRLRVSGLTDLALQRSARSLALTPVSVAPPTPEAVEVLGVCVACFTCELPDVSEYQGSTGGGTGSAAVLLLEEEKKALLAMFKHQVLCQAGSAASRRTAAATEVQDMCTEACPAVAMLEVAVIMHCWPGLGQTEWQAILRDTQSLLVATCKRYEVLAVSLSKALRSAAATVLGTLGSSGSETSSEGAMALHLLRRLSDKGVLHEHPAYKALQRAVAEALQAVKPTASCTAGANLASAVLEARAGQLLQRQAQARSEQLLLGELAGSCSDCCEGVLRLLLAVGGVEALLGAAAVPGASQANCPSSASEVVGAVEKWRAGELDMWSTLSNAAVRVYSLGQRGPLISAAAGMDSTFMKLDLGPDAADAAFTLVLHPKQNQLRSATYQLLLDSSLLQKAVVCPQDESGEDFLAPDYQGGDVASYLVSVGMRAQLANAITLKGPGTQRVYLTAWAIVLSHLLSLHFESAQARVMGQALREVPELISDLLDYVIQFLPLSGPGGPGRGKGGRQSGIAAGKVPDKYVSPLDQLKAASIPQGKTAVRDVACALYSAVLSSLPASARTWFGDLRDKAVSAAVEQYTATWESPALLAAEIANIQAQGPSYATDQFTVKASFATREVVAIMEVEDGASLELVVKIPTSVPLRAPEVECRKKVGVNDTRLRKWLLSISAFLRNQNRGVADAIALWKKNVDKEFEGVEPCLICYSVISSTNSQLPRLQCRTCNLRFHPACLYKWFKSSAKSQCPHCQSPW